MDKQVFEKLSKIKVKTPKRLGDFKGAILNKRVDGQMVKVPLDGLSKNPILYLKKMPKVVLEYTNATPEDMKLIAGLRIRETYEFQK